MKTEPQCQAVVFDMDGLLIDSEPTYQLTWKESCAAFGYTLSDEVNRSMLGLNNDDSEAVLFQTFGQDFPIEPFRKTWAARWWQIAREQGIAVKEGALDLIDTLATAAVPMAIATSSEREKVEFCLPQAGITFDFQTIVCGPEVARGKPAPDIYQAAAQQLQQHPHACVALEDSNNGMRAAKSAGMYAIMVPDLKQAEADVATQADAICSCLGEARPLVLNYVGIA